MIDVPVSWTPTFGRSALQFSRMPGSFVERLTRPIGAAAPQSFLNRDGYIAMNKRHLGRLSVAVALSTLFCLSTSFGQPSSVDSLRWLEGHWKSDSDGETSEEIWSSPAGSIMLGVSRSVGADGRVFFEYLRIEETDSGLVYLAQPLGREAAAFPLKIIESSAVVFENLSHDFPQRIAYTRDRDVLQARIEGVVDGAERSAGWEWHLQSR